MTKKSTKAEVPEVAAIATVYEALKGLSEDAQVRVLAYVAEMLHLPRTAHADKATHEEPDERRDAAEEEASHTGETDRAGHADLEGISPVARRWMTRNGLSAERLAKVFSLGVDEIDLIAKTVPGKKKTQRMRSVFLLKGLAAYLGTGAARFTHEQMKEACLHYDAFDAANFAVNFKALSSEVTGAKESGYALNARGLSSATEMVKSLTE